MLDFLNIPTNEPKRKATIHRKLPNNKKLEEYIVTAVRDNQITTEEATKLKELLKSKISARFRTEKELRKLSKILKIQGLWQVLEQKEKGRVIAALNKVITSTKKDVDTILSDSKSKEKTRTGEKTGILPSKNISSNGILRGVRHLALHDIINPREHPTIKITLSKNSVYKSSMDGKTYTVSYRNGRYRFANGRRLLIGDGDKIWGVSRTENNPKDKENTVVGKSTEEEQKIDTSNSERKIAKKEKLNYHGELNWKEARKLLSGFKVKSSSRGFNEKGDNRAKNRTCLDGLRVSTVDFANILAKKVWKQLIITGGTEKGHKTKKRVKGKWVTYEHSHYNGYKLDFSSTKPLLNYLAKLRGRKTFPMDTSITRIIEGYRVKFYRHEPDHIDMQVVKV